MFTSHNPAAVEQLQRIAQWLEKHVAQTDANDPELALLKHAEQVAAEKVSSSSEDDLDELMQAHNRAVSALVQYISSK
jgi:hypothetical protein